jgi:4-alpha-glucanotransferase
MKLQFFIKFRTEFGQSLWISGSTEQLGNNDPARAVPMEYLNEEFWFLNIEIKKKDFPEEICYCYILKNKDGSVIKERGNDKQIDITNNKLRELQLFDTWNYAGDYENAFYSDAFTKVLLKTNRAKGKSTTDKNFTHVFKVKAPLLQKNEIVCLLGNSDRLENWSEEKPVFTGKEGNYWTANLDLSGGNFPMAYKYAVYNARDKKFVCYEEGPNRIISSHATGKRISILHDGFVRLPNNTWKGAGVAIPVFSLRSKNSFGTGEFTDIKLLADWAKSAGIKLIQLLPVNDTISTNTWIDSYPYSAISAFALHPLYINLWKVAGKEYAGELRSLRKKQKQLNDIPEMDYEELMKIKISVLKQLYEVMSQDCFESDDYKQFFNLHKSWLQPYAAFCHFRDIYQTTHFEEWETNSIYKKEDIEYLCSTQSQAFKETGFYFFTQFHLYVQLKEAVNYAHKKGIVLKGDIPIGISRYSCDLWADPEMFDLNWQAGAPPDDFALVGQNWGFPIYNWKKMQEDNFTWWKQRFEQISNYYDAFRIDHILGFFRIWSIPEHAVQGIMGRFIPCLPVHMNEFGENGIWFDYRRYCCPYITDEVLGEIFGDQAELVKESFLVPNDFGSYDLEPRFNTQRKVEEHFALPEQSEGNEKLKPGLFELISNVLLFREENLPGEDPVADRFHFRISMESTSSFRHLIPHEQEKLRLLYINYFYHRQDDGWKKEAMQKLPQLKAATDMLVCGEDLGMVPPCVPEIMQQLGILSLEVQRMPKDPHKEFLHPDDAPYMSVITPSTHDMSTIREWWEENRERTERFYKNILGQSAGRPETCESWINRAIVLQHLYAPAMWSIFQLQDILGMSETLRRENPREERINNPANPKHYWQYRMHIPLEELIKQKEFNEELKGYVVHSGRG